MIVSCTQPEMKLDYTIKFSSRRKKLTITIERDRSILVNAPEGTSPAKIEQIVESKKQWIFEKIRHSQKYDDLPHPPGKELVAGESMPYLGRNYRIEIIDNQQEDIHFRNKFFVSKQVCGQGGQVFQNWYKEKAKEKIVPRVRQIAKALGVEYKEIKITDSKYRWGSCTVNDNLNFNWRLIKAPMFVVDYVIAHELAHLLEANHTPRFWNIVKTQITHFDKAKGWLKEHGEILELEL